MTLSSPQEIAEKGEEIYKPLHQTRLEASDRAKFVAVDVTTEKPYVGLTPANAYEAARRDKAPGPFHLIKIGDIGAFRVTFTAPILRRAALPV